MLGNTSGKIVAKNIIQAQVDGNVFYVKGDIRSAKFQDIERPITVRMKEERKRVN